MSALIVHNDSICKIEVSEFEEFEVLLLLSIIHEIQLYGAQLKASRDALRKPYPYSLTVLEGITRILKVENILHALK
jgi:hypothetical protein